MTDFKTYTPPPAEEVPDFPDLGGPTYLQTLTDRALDAYRRAINPHSLWPDAFDIYRLAVRHLLEALGASERREERAVAEELTTAWPFINGPADLAVTRAAEDLAAIRRRV